MKNTIQQGFTLIEMMITLVIAGIIAAIAVPSYQGSVIKSRRNECRVGLVTMMQEQERKYSVNFSYIAVSDSAASTEIQNWSGDGGYDQAYCKISAKTCAGSADLSKCVELNAKPNYTDADIQTIKLDSRGTKSCDPASNQNLCWPK